MNRTSEAELRAMTEQGLNFLQIAEKLQINLHSIRIACGVLGISSPHRPKGRVANPEKAKQYLAQIARGESIAQISRSHGVSRQAVYDALRRAQLPTNPAAYLRSQAVKKEAA